jgi:hypothetical protein
MCQAHAKGNRTLSFLFGGGERDCGNMTLLRYNVGNTEQENPVAKVPLGAPCKILDKVLDLDLIHKYQPLKC